ARGLSPAARARSAACCSAPPSRCWRWPARMRPARSPRSSRRSRRRKRGRRPMHDALLYKRLLLQARQYWLHIVGLFLVSLLATPLVLLGPVPMRIVVDCVIGSKPLPALLHRVAPDALQRSRPAILIFAVALVVLTALLSQLQALAAYVLR